MNAGYSALLWLPALLLANTVWQAFCYGIAVGALQAVEFYLDQYCQSIEAEAMEREIESIDDDASP